MHTVAFIGSLITVQFVYFLLMSLQDQLMVREMMGGALATILIAIWVRWKRSYVQR